MNKTKKILLGVMLALVLVLSVGISACSLQEDKTPTTPTTSSDSIPVNGTPESTSADTTASTLTPSSTVAGTTALVPPVADTEKPYETVSVSTSEMYTGPTVVVNKEFPYSYRAATVYAPSELDRLSDAELAELGWVSLYRNKSDLFLLRSRLIFLRSETYRAFHQMMSDYVAKSGNRDVQVRFGYQLINGANDAASLSDERATGYVVEINVYTEEGSFSIDHVSKRAAYYDWFAAHCHTYGFIMTGESGLFRYVGTPHAYYMQKHNLTLEEYVQKLGNHPYESPLRFQDESGILWSVYSVLASNTSLTEIPIDENTYHTISGDNKTGFIVSSRAK